MKNLVLLLTLVFSVSSLASKLDLRKLQFPVDSAKESAKSSFPRFCGYLDDKGGAPRVAGLKKEQRNVIRKKYKLKVMNEYRLYDKSPLDKQEKLTLERYCTRYNRQLWKSLGLRIP